MLKAKGAGNDGKGKFAFPTHFLPIGDGIAIALKRNIS